MEDGAFQIPIAGLASVVDSGCVRWLVVRQPGDYRVCLGSWPSRHSQFATAAPHIGADGGMKGQPRRDWRFRLRLCGFPVRGRITARAQPEY